MIVAVLHIRDRGRLNDLSIVEIDNDVNFGKWLLVSFNWCSLFGDQIDDVSFLSRVLPLRDRTLAAKHGSLLVRLPIN